MTEAIDKPLGNYKLMLGSKKWLEKDLLLEFREAKICLLFWYWPTEICLQKNANARQTQHNQIELIIMQFKCTKDIGLPFLNHRKNPGLSY